MPAIRKKSRAKPEIKLNKAEVGAILERELTVPDCNKTLITGELVHENYPDIFKLCKITVDRLGNATSSISNYAQCRLCSELLVWDGGNVKRHSNKRCSEKKAQVVDPQASIDPSQRHIIDFVPKNLTNEQLKQISSVIVDYCLATGCSFKHMEDPNFQRLIVGTLSVANAQFSNGTVQDQLPGRKKIARSCEEKAAKKIGRMYEKMLPLFEEHKVTLAIDFGKQHGVDFLAVCVSFLDDDWKLKVLPFGFQPCVADSKTYEEVYLMLEKLAIEAGIQPEVLRSAYMCADGAANLEKCAEKKFKGYIKCANHGIHKFAERALEPYQADLPEYTFVELDALNNLNSLLSDCRTLSLLVKGTKKIRGKLSALPNAGAPTRWLSFLACVQDLFKIIHILVEHDETKELATHLLSNQKKLNSLLFVLGPLQQWSLLFQTEDVTIHLVAPLYRQLLSEFESQRDGVTTPTNQNSTDHRLVRIISKSACLALKRQYELLHDVHFAAAFLSPATKKMKSFEHFEFAKAKKYVEEMLKPSVTVRRPPSRDQPSGSMCVLACRTLADDDSDEETISELSSYLKDSTDKMEPLAAYWARKKDTWPALFEAATRIFGIVPSEAACERAFSTSGRIFDKLRTSLDPERVDWIITTALLNKADF